MTENLKTSRYNDGTAITNVTDNEEWDDLTIGAYAYYNNDASHNATYGKLYNWYAVNTGKLCPNSWHILTEDEWIQLENYLGGSSVAGGKMKATTLWASPNTGVTNESGFSGLPSRHSLPNGTTPVWAASVTGGVLRRTILTTLGSGTCITITVM